MCKGAKRGLFRFLTLLLTLLFLRLWSVYRQLAVDVLDRVIRVDCPGDGDRVGAGFARHGGRRRQRRWLGETLGRVTVDEAFDRVRQGRVCRASRLKVSFCALMTRF